MNMSSSPRPSRCGRMVRQWTALLLIGVGIAATGTARAEPLAVKVLVVNMFGLEAAPWLSALAPESRAPRSRSVERFPDRPLQRRRRVSDDDGNGSRQRGRVDDGGVAERVV